MKYVIGALVGIVWGCIGAFINCSITKAAIKKNKDSAMLIANLLRITVDIVLLGIIVLEHRVRVQNGGKEIRPKAALTVLPLVLLRRIKHRL